MTKEKMYLANDKKVSGTSVIYTPMSAQQSGVRFFKSVLREFCVQDVLYVVYRAVQCYGEILHIFSSAIVKILRISSNAIENSRYF